MNALTEKRYLTLPEPSAGDTLAARERLLAALPEGCRLTLGCMQQLYPVLHEAGYRVTVTLCPGAGGTDVVRVEPGDTTDRNHGLCLDIGSTTMQMELVDLLSGKTLAEAACTNSQTQFGANILDRILAVKENPDNLHTLQALTLDDVRQMIERCCAQAGVPPEAVSAMTVGGNTTMLHFFLGCDPWQVFQSPYTPVFFDPGVLRASELGLPIAGNIFCMPAIANYLGGDITSGLLMTDLDTREDLALFLDIGTNGELVLGCREFLLMGAGAAGPALEGAVSRSGMRAEPGAICRIKIGPDNRLRYETVGGLAPKGICGSGIIDVIAELYRTSIISSKGQFVREGKRVAHDEHGMGRYILATAAESETGREISITEVDIDSFIRAKAAIFSAINIMLSSLDMDVSVLSHVYVAGGIGSGINMENAVRIGMLPDIDRELFEYLGNTSLSGAYAMARSDCAVDKVDELASNMTYMELSTNPRYMDEFVAACFLPHTSRELFPSSIQE